MHIIWLLFFCPSRNNEYKKNVKQNASRVAKNLLSIKSLVNVRKLIKQSAIATNNMRCAWMTTLTANKKAKKRVA